MTDYNDESRRTRIAKALVESFKTLPVSQEEGDYRFGYSEVTRSVVSNTPTGKALVMGIYPSTEQKDERTHPKTNVRMDVIFEMYYHREKGKEPVDALEKILSEAERRLMEDQTLGGLAINCTVLNTQVDLDGRFDNYCDAAMTVEITFQHHRVDPRRSVSDAK